MYTYDVEEVWNFYREKFKLEKRFGKLKMNKNKIMFMGFVDCGYK